MNNNIDKRISKTLHVSSDSHEHECNNDIKGTQSTQSEDNVCTEFRTMYNNYQTISESEINLGTTEVKWYQVKWYLILKILITVSYLHF